MKKHWLFYAIPAGISVLFFLLFPEWEVDDAYIILRYARNWVETGTPIWNPGEDPVEGYTGMTWLAIATLLTQWNLSPLPVLKCLGVISFFLTYGLIVLIGRKLQWHPWVQFGGLLAYACAAFLYTHAASGLETLFFMCSLTVSLYLYLNIDTKRKFQAFLFLGLSLSLLLNIFTRPEGILVGIVMIPFLFFNYWQHQRSSLLKAVAIVGLAAILPGVIYFFWRWNFYGQFLPNTVYAKAYDGFFNFEIFIELIRFVVHYLAGPLLLLVPIIILAKRRKTTTQAAVQATPNQLVLLLSLILGGFIIGYSQTHLYMGYSFRFLAPLLPFGLICVGTLINKSVSRLSLIPKSWKWAFLAILLLQSVLWGRKMTHEVSFVKSYRLTMDNSLKPTANFLSTQLLSNAKLAVYLDAGFVPYYTNFNTLDFGKLNNKTLSRLPYGDPKAIDYFFDQKPDAAVFTSFKEEKYAYIPEAMDIQADPRFKSYKQMAVFSNSTYPAYYQFVYIREDSKMRKF